MSLLLTPQDLAVLLDCAPEKVNEEAAAGRLPGLKIGRSWRFPAGALEEALNAIARENLRREPKALAADAPDDAVKRRRRAAPVLPSLPTAGRQDRTP